MPTAEEYRVKAVDLNAQAKLAPNSSLRAECEKLALSYLRLAAQAEKNAQTDIIYEPPTATAWPQAQPEQQPQSKRD